MHTSQLLERHHETHTAEDIFTPRLWTRNPHLQSFLKSQKWLIVGKNPMVDCAEEMILDGGNGARLLGYYSPHPTRSNRGLMLLLHGWEGSTDSAYILHTGRYFFNAGYDIFRLNLRDHGNSHHLNKGLFHGGLIDEVAMASKHIARLAHDRPFSIVGFSLGGNFAMRVALQNNESSIENLSHVFSICPVIDPLKSTSALDYGNPFYKQYFLKKWWKSLRKKQAAFPEIYDIDVVFTMTNVMEITNYIIPRYMPFRNHREYFSTYTLVGDIFTELCTPVTIIAAEDDPVVEISDFYLLRGNENLHLSIQRYGGHCGFIDPFPFGCWYERKIDTILQNERHIS